MEKTATAITTILFSIVTLAGFALFVSKKGHGPQLIQALGTAFTSALGAAVGGKPSDYTNTIAPVTAGIGYNAGAASGGAANMIGNIQKGVEGLIGNANVDNLFGSTGYDYASNTSASDVVSMPNDFGYITDSMLTSG